MGGEAYLTAYPCDQLVGCSPAGDGLETVDIIRGAIEKGVLVNLVINNRAGGNAPMIGQEIATKFVPENQSTSTKQGSLR